MPKQESKVAFRHGLDWFTSAEHYIMTNVLWFTDIDTTLATCGPPRAYPDPVLTQDSEALPAARSRARSGQLLSKALLSCIPAWSDLK